MRHENRCATFAFLFLFPSDMISLIRLTNYRTRGCEWRDCIATTLYIYMLSVILNIPGSVTPVSGVLETAILEVRKP